MLELIAAEAIDCDLTREAACTYAVSPQEREQVEREAEAARAAGLAADVRDDLPLPYETQGGVWLADQAHFHPGQCMKALAELIDGGGCRLHEQPTALLLDDEAMSVTTDRGVVTAEHIVVATHFPVFDHGALSMRAMARRSYVVAGRVPEPPRGMFITVADDHKSLRAQPSGDGAPYLLMGGEPHRTGEGGDTRARYRALEGGAADTFRPSALEFAWSTQDIFTNDDVPFIGHFRKDQERIWTATGFRGLGHDAQHGRGAHHERGHPGTVDALVRALRPLGAFSTARRRQAAQPGCREPQEPRAREDGERRPGLHPHVLHDGSRTRRKPPGTVPATAPVSPRAARSCRDRPASL